MTVGKKVGGFVLQVAARVVSKHSLNVMAGHDDVYALLPSGYTILFGSNPQEAADLAAISYKVASLSLIPVANAMDGFATSHMLSEALMPEPELLKEFLGDPAGRIKCPTVAQEMLFGAKGRVFQLQPVPRPAQRRHYAPRAWRRCNAYLDANAEAVEHDNAGALLDDTLGWIPEELHGQWRRQWLNAYEKGTRQRVPALVDREQSRPDRRRAEPARLPGRQRRPSHPFRQRGAALRARGDARVWRADRPRATRRSRPSCATTPKP